MKEMLTSISTVLATGGALYYGTQKLFKSVEEHLAPETKISLTNWIVSARLSPATAELAKKSELMLESFFGKNHWTWKCFIKSTVCSLCIYIIPFLILFSVILILAGPMALTVEQWRELAFDSEFTVFIVLPLFNILPDYLSLWKSRRILAAVKNSKRRFSGWLAISVDIALSYCISGVPVLILMAILSAEADAFFTGVEPGVWEIAKQIPIVWSEFSWELPVFNTPAAALAVVWLLIFIIGRSVLRVASRFDIFFDWVRNYLNFQEKPLQCIGVAAGSLLATGYFIFVALVWLGSQLIQ